MKEQGDGFRSLYHMDMTGNRIISLSRIVPPFSTGASTNFDAYKTINAVTFDRPKVLMGCVPPFINFYSMNCKDRLPPTKCVDQILDFTNFASSTKDDWKYLEYLFLDDVLPLECMVLQCLGFDRDLYENLIQQYRSK